MIELFHFNTPGINFDFFSILLQFHSRIHSLLYFSSFLSFFVPSFARVFFLQQWRKGFGGWCDSPCLLVNFEAGKSGEAERKTGGSSLIGNFPERNPVDHGYIWPNIAVRVNERAKGWRR